MKTPKNHMKTNNTNSLLQTTPLVVGGLSPEAGSASRGAIRPAHIGEILTCFGEVFRYILWKFLDIQGIRMNQEGGLPFQTRELESQHWNCVKAYPFCQAIHTIDNCLKPQSQTRNCLPDLKAGEHT